MRKIWMLIIALLILNSCNSEKRAAKKLVKKIEKARDTFAEHPDSFASACAIQFPPQVDSKESTTVHNGPVDTIKNTTSTDITYDLIGLLNAAKNDSIKAHIIDSLLNHPVYIKAKCPDVYVHHDTIENTTEVKVENTAKVVALTDQNNYLLVAKTKAETDVSDRDATIKQCNKTIRKLGGSLILLFILIIVYIVLKLKKYIP